MTQKNIYVGVNDELKVGDTVVSNNNAAGYDYLVGTVIEINKVGTPEHEDDTDNDTDNIHVNFLHSCYSPQRIREIETALSELYGESKSFDDLALDDVIMASDMLLQINGIPEEDMTALLDNEASAIAVFERLQNPA